MTVRSKTEGFTSSGARFAVAAAVVVAAIGGLIAYSLNKSKAYYVTPSEVLAGEQVAGKRVRIAGTVVPGSINRSGKETDFQVTDGKASLPVTTRDLLPDTFSAGIEVVAEGAIVKGQFQAASVLVKCPSKFKAKLKSS